MGGEVSRVCTALLQTEEDWAKLAFRACGPCGAEGSCSMLGRLSNTVETVGFNGMVLDVAGHSLVNAAGHDVKLTHGEFALLVALTRYPDRVLSREQLLDAVSGRSADAFDRSIDNLVARLRRKIEREIKRPRVIVTVRGAGYKFCSQRDVRETPPNENRSTIDSLAPRLGLPFPFGSPVPEFRGNRRGSGTCRL
jgi:DNA-binding response OmpR family regulator